MGADQDINLAGGGGCQSFFVFSDTAEPGNHLNPHRKFFQSPAETLPVLPGQYRSRHQHRHLFAVKHRLERGPQSDFGLAIANITADQPVHRFWRLHVAQGVLDCPQLVFGLLVRKGRLEFAIELIGGRTGKPLTQFALGIKFQ